MSTQLASVGLPMDEVLVVVLVAVLSLNKSMFLDYDKKEPSYMYKEILCLSRMAEPRVYANFKSFSLFVLLKISTLLCIVSYCSSCFAGNQKL